MSYHSDRAILHAVPRVERRLSRRLKAMMIAVLCLAVIVSAVVVWQMREAGKPTELELARAEVVMAYLTEHHADAPWYGSIIGVTFKDNRLYVRTDYDPHDVDAIQASLDKTWARRVYEVLWNWHWEVPELEIYYVYIQNKDGNIIDGGQA